MTTIRDLVSELTDVFSRHKDDKLAAHQHSWPILEQATRDPHFLGSAFNAYVNQPGALRQGSFPVVTMTLARNAHFGLVCNCWVPLPSRETHWTTTAVHHHGDMMMSTCTAFGGYRHLYFDLPVRTGRDEIFELRIVEEASHPKHHVLFVDAWRPHVPFYPAGVTVTLALWSHRFPLGWADYLKGLSLLQGREESLRTLVRRLGLSKRLDLREAEYYDYYPTDRGFVGMKVRQQIGRGPIADHVRNVLCILQATGNESLAGVVEEKADAQDLETRRTLNALLADIRCGRAIEGRLASHQFRVAHMHFTRQDIDRALVGQREMEDRRGRELAAS